MKTRVSMTVTLTLLLLPGVLWAMEAAPAAEAPTPALRMMDPGVNNKVVVRQLRHYPAAQVTEIAQAIAPEGEVTIAPDGQTNSVTMTGPLGRLEQISDLLSLLDSSELAAPVDDPNIDRQIVVFHLEHCLAGTAVNTLKAAFQDKVPCQADTRTNALLVMAADENMDRIRDFVEVLDSPVSDSPSAMPAMQIATEGRRPRAADPTPDPPLRGGRPAPARTPRTPLADAEPEVQAYRLQYCQADQIAEILFELLVERDDITVVPSLPGNQILVSASPAGQQMVRDLIQELDTPPVDEPQKRQMLCRVYMLELPPADSSLKRFQITLEGTGPTPTENILRVVQNPELGVQDFSRHMVSADRWELGILGWAPSREHVSALVAAFPDTQIRDFSWQEDTTADVEGPEYQASQPLQEHLRRLLGDELQTVGYWFGDLSVPGEVRAPIGPWTLELSMQPDQGDELAFSVNVEQTQREGTRGSSREIIISNFGRGRVGKPIIIGYNRDRNGTRAMGALVIVPEPADPAL